MFDLCLFSMVGIVNNGSSFMIGWFCLFFLSIKGNTRPQERVSLRKTRIPQIWHLSTQVDDVCGIFHLRQTIYFTNKVTFCKDIFSFSLPKQAFLSTDIYNPVICKKKCFFKNSISFNINLFVQFYVLCLSIWWWSK